MSGVILPGRFGLIIPKEPIGHCDVCEVPFFSQRDVRLHMASTQHEEGVQRVLEAERRRKNRLAFMHEDPDPEVTAHMEQVGKKMLKEGRWTVKPSERAGFS